MSLIPSFPTEQYSKPIKKLCFRLDADEDDILIMRPNWNLPVYAEAKTSSSKVLQVKNSNDDNDPQVVANITNDKNSRTCGSCIEMHTNFECRVIERMKKSHHFFDFFDQSDILLRCVRRGHEKDKSTLAEIAVVNNINKGNNLIWESLGLEKPHEMDDDMKPAFGLAFFADTLETNNVYFVTMNRLSTKDPKIRRLGAKVIFEDGSETYMFPKF